MSQLCAVRVESNSQKPWPPNKVVKEAIGFSLLSSTRATLN